MNKRFRISLMIIGGLLMNAVGGNFNNFGIICPYIASYFYHKDSSIRNSDFTIVPGIAAISESLTTLMMSYLINWIRPYFLILIISSISCAVMFSSSFVANPYLFCWVYGISLGTLASSLFLPSLWILWDHIKENKGKTTGIMLCGYSLGAVPFGLMFTYLANPYDDQAHKVHGNGDESEKMFGTGVSDRVPWAIRWTTIAYFGCTLLGLMLMPRKTTSASVRESISKPPDAPKDSSILELVKIPQFWNFFFMLLNGFIGLLFVQLMYKIIGIIYIGDDHFVSFVGMASFIFSSATRLVYGYLLDKFYWKKIMVPTYIMTGMLLVTMPFVLENRVLYGIYIILINMLGTGVYNSILLQTERDFPGDKRALSCVCLAFIPLDFSTYLFEQFVTPYVGYQWIFLVLSAFNVIVVLQVLLHKPRKGKVDSQSVNLIE